MGKNNPLRSMTPKNKNYKLYKAKKQWITACATFMLAFGATAVVNASVQADTTTPATTQASGSTTTESAQPQSSAAETAQNTNETKRNVVANTTDTSKTGEQKTTTAQDTENSSSASSANKINSEEENKNAFLALNVNTADNATTTQALQENTIAAATATTPTTNGGYDSATWGTLDTSKWTGQTATFDGNNYYQLTGYTGDQTHIIVPNEADFEQAGKSTNNLQVSISNDLIKSWQNAATIAFSKTDDKKIKLASTNLDSTFQRNTTLTNLDANSLDTSSVTSMQRTFENASNLSSLTGISDWNVQKVTDMTRIFNNVNKVPDLSPLSNWKTDSLQNLNTAFANNSFTNLQGLENWNVSHVTDMNSTFMGDTILNDLNALVKWDISNVTNLSMMFNRDSNLVTLTGLENWNTSKVTNLYATFANEGSLVDASAIANWNTSNVTNMSNLFTNSNAQYVDLSKWDFSKVNSASDVIRNVKTVVYLGDNSTITADKLNTLGIANGSFTQPIILASGNLYTLLSNKNNTTHNITINNADSGQSTTISFPVVYDAAGASNMTDAINSYKDMVDQKLEDYVTEHNYVLKRVSTAPVDDVTGHNNHLVNYANATYQVVTIPVDQKKNLQIQDKTTYKGKTLTAKDLVTNVADFPSGTTFEFADNSEPNWNQVGTYNVKVIATYPVSVNGQQYTAVTAPATAKVTVTQQMQFTITYWDDTENKEITQFDIKNAGNGGYTRLTFPNGVNPGKYQSVSVSGVPVGATVAGDFWVSFTDSSCNWTIPNYRWTTEAASSFYGANIVVHLVHKTQDVTNTDPDAQETRTVTADFVKINENGTPEAAPFDSATLDVCYIRKATKDLVTDKVTYGNWKLNTNKSSNGFQIVSGAWDLPTDSSSNITVTAPDLDGYEKADTQINGQLTTDFGTADSITSKLTTYYVPKSLTQKTINRVINVTPVNQPGAPSVIQTTTQSATITRPVKVNADDSGVIFDGFDGSGWTTGKWGRYNNIPVPNNYTKVIKQIVTHPDGTTTETTLDIPNWRPIPAQTVTIATLPTVINITYTATATAFLAGTNESTYTGQPITLSDLNYGNGDDRIHVGITGPTGNVYTLQAGDVEFSSDNGQTWTTEMPTNAGTYELRWSEQGKQNIIKEFGNNSIKWVDAQGNSTFTSTATYIINPKPITNVTVSGDQSKTYDGQQASVDGAGLTISGNGTIANSALTARGLPASDFDWYTLDGTKLNAIPTDSGSYEARLNATGLKDLQKINSNYSFDAVSGTIKYTIDKAKAIATIGGSYERDYNGQPIDGTSIYNKITWVGRDTSNNKDFTLNHSITASDYAWYTKSGDQYIKFQGQPVNAGVYYLILNKDYRTTLDKANPNYDISKVGGAFVYTINQAQAGSVAFNASVQKIYNGSAVLNGASFNTAPSIVIKGVDGKALAGLNNYTFQSGDFEFVDSTGKTVLATINNNGQISGPINAGTYTIRLTQAGLDRIEQANPNINFANVKLADTGSGTLTISQYAPKLNLSGNGSKTYDGQVITSAELIKQDKDNTITIKLTVPKQGGGTTEVTYAFNPKMDYTGDYDWYSNGAKINAPKNAGTYVIKLKADQVKTILEDLVSRDSNYSYLKGNLDFNNAQITGQASYTINKKPLTVYLDGESSAVYTGSGAEMPLQDLIKHLDANGLVNGETLNTDTFDKADFQWYVKNADGTYSVFTGKDAQGNPVQTPINVGTYYIGILPETSTNSGIDTLQRDNTNYDVTIDYSKYYQFDITPAKGTITLSGGQTDTYNGQAHNITGYTLTISGVGLPSGQTVTLKDGDLEYYVDGQWTTSVPKNAGTYQVRLSNSALTELERSYTNFSWTSDNVINNAQEYVINPTQVQVSFTGEPKHVIYNGQGVSVDYGSDAMKGYFNITGLVNGDKLIYPSLSSDQFEWINSTGNVMTTVPVNVGTYTLRLKTTSDMDKLNSNYNFVFAKDSAGNDINGWQWIIDKATATITFTTGNQNTPWTGQPTVLNPDNFAVTISTNNGRTLTASGLEASDFQFYDQSGQAISTPTAVGNYIIKLKQSGLDKIEKDTANYTWINNANGSYEITKAQVSIKLNGESSMTYNGQAASFPVNSDGSVKGITVTLSNGKTYTLKPGDLAFVNGNGEFIDAPVNAGDYKVTLSQVGLNNINKIDGENYQYTLDENDKTANFTIEKADATIVLNGTGTHVYNGQAASTNEGSYTIQLPGQTASTNVNAANLVFVDGAPTNVGTYSIALSDAYKKQLQDIYGNNYNLTFTNGSFTVTPKTVNLILNGYSSQIYNGQPAKVSNISNLTLTWGDHTTTTAPGDVKFTLLADDLEVVNKNGQTPTAANSASQENNPYYVQLKNSILNQLDSQNKNYKFVIGDTYARYTIYAKESNVTFTGKQFANYGSNPMPAIDPSNYTLTWTDIDGHSHNIEITAADLTVEVPSGVPTDKNGLPLNAGQYVVKVKQSVIDNFNAQHPDYKLSNDPNTNAWYVVKHRQVSFTINGTPSSTYNGQAVSLKDGNYSISFGPISGNQNSGVLSGDQNAFDSIKWDASDFEFVNGAPTTAGTYQVCLSSAGLKKLQEFANGATGSNYDFSSDVTVDNGQFTASSVTANYTVNKNELTVSLINKDGKVPSSVIGKYGLSAGNYTLTITPTETIYGTDGKPLTLTYNLKDTDLAYKNGTPSNIGTYDVQLTAAAISDLEQKFGTENYTYKLSPSATHEITKGTGMITLSGGQTETYTGQPAVLKYDKYFVTVTTNIYSDSSYLNAGDMQFLVFYTKNADGSYTQLANKPTDIGTYYVGLNDDMVKLIKDATGNNGDNYNWSQNYATYVITAAKGTASGSFTNSSTYNAQPIGKQDIKVNVDYPGAKSNTYTLQEGDYEYVNEAGSVVVDPTDAGTYTIRLTTAGENHIKQLGNLIDAQGNITKQNVNWTVNFAGSYTINAVRMTVTVNGTQNETYNGNAKTVNIGGPNGVNVTISADGLTVPTIPTTGINALTADDFTIKDAQGQVVTDPTNAGAYKVYLNSKGLEKLGKLSTNFIVPESLEQSANLIIARQDVNITEGSAGKTFDAQSAALTEEQFAQYKKAITDAGYSVDGLTIDGIDWWFDDTVDYGTQGNQTNPIKDIGTYNLRLNAKGQKELDNANPNYKLKVGDFQYTIYPEVVHIEVDGTQNANWDNQGVAIDPTKFVPKFVVYGGKNGDQLITNPVRDDGQPLTLPAGVQLVPSDYEFVDDNGNVITSFKRQDGTTSTNPFKVGTYHVRLTENGWKKLATQSTDNVKYQYDNSTGTLNINQITPEIKLNGANWKIYDDQPVSFDELVSKDPTTNQALIYVGVSANGHTINLPLAPGTYNWNSNGQLLKTAPSQVGTYTITLNKDKVITYLNNWMANNSDYQGAMKILADNIGGSALFEIKARNIAKLEADPASGSQTYTGQAVQIDLSTIVGSLKATDSDGKVWKLNTDTLTLDDYTITDSNGKIVTGFPVNVGTYTFKINEKGIAALASANPDFAIPNEINGYSYTYTINQANAIGKLTGSNSGAYTGKPVTTAQVNSNGQIMVTVDYPGVAISNKTYTLKAGDYTWSTENGFAPTDAGKYTITLTKDGIANIENYIRAFAGTGQDGKSNVAFAENAITGSATFEIVPKSITDVTISGNAQEKTYDGQAASLDVNDLTISATDLVTDSPLSMKDITASDFDWYDVQGKKLDAIPTDAGTYEARLKSSALQTLQKDNPNYSFNTVSGMIKYTINQKAATDTLGGNGNKVYNSQGTSVSDVLNSITWTPSGLVDGQSLDPADLTEADYAWYTKNADDTYTEMTGLPTNAGTYYLKLKDSSIAKIQAANPNYSFATGAISGEYTYKINQANATITLPDTSDQNVIWTGKPATIDPARFIPEITTDNPNEKTIALPNTLQLTASDYEFLQNGKVISAPSEIGTYQVRLTQAGWQKVQNAIAGNANYTWNYQGEGNYHIEKASATITLDGSASTIYTGNPVVIPATDGVVNSINVKLSNGQTYVLKPADLEFVDKQGNQIPVPTNAGSYRVRLTEAALDQIQKLENNHYNYTYNNDAVDFIVEKATADVTTSGSYDVVYNGQTPEINVDKITNTISTNNGVDLTAPTLSADDYEWVDEDGKAIANPVNVGTYYLKLKDSSQSEIATNNNYTWNFNGLASVTINKANATVSFNGNQETPYTGSVVALDPGNFEVKLSNGQTYQLTAKDIQVIDNPINVGTYQVELSQAGIAAIKAADSNYNYSYDGSKGSLTIVPAKATATLSGSQTTQDLELDPSHYTVMVNGQTITGLTASDFIFSKDGHPAQLTEAGTYAVELSEEAISKIRQENPNYNIAFSSTATFTLENSSQTINYVDADGKVISTFSVGGKLKGNQVEFTPQFPAGWVASDPSSVPSEITLENGITTIKIKHGITNVDHTNPVPDGEKTVTGSVIDGAHENDLNQTITRTIVVTNPDGTKQTIPQAAKIYRNATYDDVTGTVTYGEWSTGDWKEFSPAEIKGYTVSEKVVPAVEVKNGQQDETVNITYTANEQTGKISYQDTAGNEIGSTTITGKTGETITVTPEVPAGWEIVPGQDIPATVTATADGIPTVVIKIKHSTTNVDHTNPVPDGEKTVTGSVINGAHENDLNQTITRTIVVTNPDGTKQTIPQAAKIYRNATYDDVTGTVTYGEWSTGDWKEFSPAEIKGYTVSEKVVPAVEVKNGQQDETVNITYTANEQTGKISYQDTAGNEIGSTTITGKTGETITVTPEVPAGWEIVPGQDVPKTVTATADGIPMVIVKVEHKTVVVAPETPATDIPTGKVPGDPSKNYPTMEQLTVTPTRTINVKYPSGKEESIPQKVTFTRTAIFDEVTGEIKYTEWLPQGAAQWASYQPTTVTGYVPSQKIVPAMTVNPETPNETIDVTYDKIPEPQEGQEIISYQDANGQVIHTQTVTGEEGGDVSFKPEVPTNWQPTGDLPHSVKITGGTTVIVIEPVTVPVQEHKTVTRIIVEHLPSGDKQTVQTVVLTGTGTKNLVTGEVTDVKWDHGKFAAFTPATVPGYTTNMSIVPEMDVTTASGDSTVEINYIPNEQTGMIIYRDENGSDISQTVLQGKTGEKIAVNLTVPAGWQLVPGQSIPATVMATPDGIPDVVVLIKHQMITVKPGQTAPSGQVPGNPSATYEKMGSLTKEVTRTITVKLPDGQRQIITQTVKFTRTATFDAVTGKATYSAWQVDGSNEWPAYTAPAINGYTATQTAVSAEMVIPSDENQSIEIEYTKNNQPVEPDKPVTPITPDQPTTPTNPDQPAQPTEPSVPAKPIAPTNNGDKVMSGNQLPAEPVKQERQQVPNQHFISHQLTQTSSKEKSKANILPQTGNDQNSSSILGFAFAALASIFGLTGLKKKKREK